MRILHLSHYYPPETPGGTQEYVAELAALQREAGHTVAVIAGAREPLSGETVRACEQDGIRVWRCLRDLPRENLSGDLGCARIGTEIERLAVQFAPDLAHVHHWHALTRDVVRRLRARGIPVVLTLHDLFTTCPRSFRMPDHRSLCPRESTLADCAACLAPDVPGLDQASRERLLEERARELFGELAAASRVLAISRAQAELLCALPRFPLRDLVAEPIGIRTDGIVPRTPAPAPGKLRIVNWAGLDPRKGIHVLVEAVAGSARRDALELHLHGRAGEAGYMAELRAKAEGARVEFHGPFEDSERFRFAERHDLAVFPFLAFETHGLVVDEALHSGLPVVVSDRGAPASRIGGRGLAVSPEPLALRRTLEILLDAPERLRRMRWAAHGARDLRSHALALEEHYAAAAG